MLLVIQMALIIQSGSTSLAGGLAWAMISFQGRTQTLLPAVTRSSEAGTASYKKVSEKSI